MFQNVLFCMKQLWKDGHDETICSITNQRETIVPVERSTGRCLYNAISWMDTRTGEICRNFHEKSHSEDIQLLTGLKFSPFFSVFKMVWLLQNVADVQNAVLRDDLVFCTVDSWILSVIQSSLFEF